MQSPPDARLPDCGHRAGRRRLGVASAIDSRAEALAITTAILHRARRQLWLHSRQLDPGLLDAPPVQAALRRFVTARHDKQLRVIVHDAAMGGEGRRRHGKGEGGRGREEGLEHRKWE